MASLMFGETYEGYFEILCRYLGLVKCKGLQSDVYKLID